MVMEANKESDKPILTLGVSSKLSGIPAHSIQQYVNNDLLIPFKLDSNRHLFSQRDLIRLKNISILLHEKGLNFSGIKSLLAMIPCWDITDCPMEVRQKCNAYYEDSIPCWEASEKSRTCKNEKCRECEVYCSLSNSSDLKSVLRELTSD
jgi:MerR family transcriptional regulator/heat shock protein HspR